MTKNVWYELLDPTVRTCEAIAHVTGENVRVSSYQHFAYQAGAARTINMLRTTADHTIASAMKKLVDN